MINARLFAALSSALAIVACSAPDPGGPARQYSPGHSSGSGSGSGAGAGAGTGSNGSGTGGSGGSGGGGGGGVDYDAGPVPGSKDYDSGASNPPSSGKDGGSGADAGTNTPPSGALGSCGNPLCGTTLSQCGCRATDSANNTIELGCQAGGQCGCFSNGQLVGAASDENGTCGTTSAVKARFLSDCACQ